MACVEKGRLFVWTVQGEQAGLGLTCARLRSPASTEALDDKVKPIGIPGEAAWPSGKADEYYFVTVRALLLHPLLFMPVCHVAWVPRMG